VEVDVDVVDVPLDYNLLLWHNWTYSMTTFVLSIFRTLCFPHEGKIVMSDQLSFSHVSPNALVGTLVPVIDNSQQETKDVGVRMYSSLMGIFDFVTPIHHIHVISSESSLSMRSVPFRTSYFNDTWTLPSLNMSYEGQSHTGMEIPLSSTEVVYHSIFYATGDLNSFSLGPDEVDPVLEPIWAIQYSCSHDFLDDTLSLDEAILEAMYVLDRPWDDMHHNSYFLPNLVRIEHDEFISTLSEMVSHDMVPLDMHSIYVEGKMVNTSPTVTIDISRIFGKIENVYNGVDCSPEEI
jgi:hypothetical protein